MSTLRTMSYAAALVEGLYSAMESDRRVNLIGSYVLGLGPQRGLMDRIREAFPGRVCDPPTAEAAAAGMGAGAAMAGSRPFVDLGTGSFAYLAWSQLVNEAAVAHHMSNGQISVPVVYHLLHGVRGGGAAQHSGSPQAMLWNAPGLEIVVPASAADVKGLLRSALDSPNPTVMVSHARLLPIEGPVPDGDYRIPFGRADIKRRGSDVTIVANSYMVWVALQAAASLVKEGIEAEVLDLRTLVPLDEVAILESVSRTGRLVVVDECPLRCGVASEIAATVAERGFGLLKSAPARVARADVPTPYSAPLEAAVTPDPAKVAAAVHRVLA
jgi:pyruvate/2-oxoglutarate/acetoin dehydrogenase E1 component